MTLSAVRRCAGVLLLATVLLTTACSGAVTGTADPAATSAPSAASSPVLPSDEPLTVVPPSDAPADDPTTPEPGSTVPDPATSPAPATSPPELPTAGSTAPASETLPETTTPDTTPPDTSAPDTTAPDTTAPASSEEPTLLAVDHFTSPTGNITCLIDSDEAGPVARCDLAESDITEKGDCGDVGDWGTSVSLVPGQPATMDCVSDTVALPGVPVLAYGESTSVDGLTCTSRENGMTCRDTSGHSFRLSRSDYEVE